MPIDKDSAIAITIASFCATSTSFVDSENEMDESKANENRNDIELKAHSASFIGDL